MGWMVKPPPLLGDKPLHLLPTWVLRPLIRTSFWKWYRRERIVCGIEEWYAERSMRQIGRRWVEPPVPGGEARWHRMHEAIARYIAELERDTGAEVYAEDELRAYELLHLLDEHGDLRLSHYMPDEGFLDVVFDAPPGPEGGRFVEVETPEGRSTRVGEWMRRADGYWVLRIPRVG